MKENKTSLEKSNLDCEHDWRFTGDMKFCIKCKKSELNYDNKSFTLHFPKELNK